ncbi:hypothetical protein [Desulfosporosinus sp. SB140]|uniref:hypothetical protein n=1 Tax=Desulfosporosinus paludis TaxID=3115649 RepID=UPI00388E3B59
MGWDLGSVSGTTKIGAISATSSKANHRAGTAGRGRNEFGDTAEQVNSGVLAGLPHR